jgi:ABC-type multidrug transport system permease subunit
MRWYYIFTKGIREQLRDYWILVLILVMVPVFIAIYFLMSNPAMVSIDVVLVNQDRGGKGEQLVSILMEREKEGEVPGLSYMRAEEREAAVDLLRKGDADVVVVIPVGFTEAVQPDGDSLSRPELMELVGNITSMEYIVGAIWTEELINDFVMETSGLSSPVSWEETALGYSAERSEFELYVPGLLILSIIMIIFSSSAAIVREPETRTLERLKISRLTSVEFLGGISLVQIVIAFLSLVFALLTSMGLGYTLIPGTLGFILLISFLTALSMISFSLIVAAMCRSIKDVAIIGTFPLFLLMFFTGAAFPVTGGRLFSVGDMDFMLNQILSPTWAIQALNKVLVTGLGVRETIPEMAAILVLTLFYGLLGTWAFKRRHMRPN